MEWYNLKRWSCLSSLDRREHTDAIDIYNNPKFVIDLTDVLAEEIEWFQEWVETYKYV